MSLLLFNDVHRELWKTEAGTVIGILNPNPMKQRDGYDGVSCRLGVLCLLTASVFLSWSPEVEPCMEPKPGENVIRDRKNAGLSFSAQGRLRLVQTPVVGGVVPHYSAPL